MYIFGIPEEVMENNPYPGYFNDKQQEKLVKFIKLGQTADAAALGLASKFEMECLNEYLLTCWGLVMLQVCILLRVHPWIRPWLFRDDPCSSVHNSVLLRGF